MLKFLSLLLSLMAATAVAQETAIGTVDIVADDSQAAKQEPVYVKVPKTYRYRVAFTDKKNNIYSLKRPEEFLSPKALERRRKYGIKVDKHDLPVTPSTWPTSAARV